MDEKQEQEVAMKIYTPRPIKTPPTQSTAVPDTEQIRIWNGTADFQSDYFPLCYRYASLPQLPRSSSSFAAAAQSADQRKEQEYHQVRYHNACARCGIKGQGQEKAEQEADH